jgi:hypothetical protein
MASVIRNKTVFWIDAKQSTMRDIPGPRLPFAVVLKFNWGIGI